MQEAVSNVSVEPGSLTYHYYISDEIGPPGDYLDLLQVLRAATTNDVVTIHLNTVGGRLDTTVQIIQAIRDSEATVLGSAEGNVYSGGSLIFFSCHALFVSPLSHFLVHSGYGGGDGKLKDNLDSAKSNFEYLASVYKDVYQPFFREDEVEEVLKGKEHYLTADEVLERIEYVAEQNQEEEYVQTFDGELVPDMQTSEDVVGEQPCCGGNCHDS